MTEVKDAVLRILTERTACYGGELSDRAYHEYGCNNTLLNRAIGELQAESMVEMRAIKYLYKNPFHFYFEVGQDRKEIAQTIDWKLELRMGYEKRRRECIARFGESLVGEVAKLLDYKEVEIRKKAHRGVGIGRKEIDVWGKHPLPKDFYQCIEVKNRRAYVGIKVIKCLEEKVKIAKEKWGLPIMPAIVCRCITKPSLRYTKSKSIPVVATSKVYVSKKHESFYNKYKEALGAYYIEVAELNNPPKDLIKLFRRYILEAV